MSHFPTSTLASIIATSRKPAQPKAPDTVWNLNLDQIEPHSGRIISKNIVKASDLGPSTYEFEQGTVLYSKLRPYLNKVVVADQDGFATTELVPLRCDTSKATPEYISHFLRSPDFLIFATNVVAGAKMPRMVMSEFWKYPVPLPVLPEQRRIAAILDQADALRAKRREALAELDGLAQAIFVEMFGDSTKNTKGWDFATINDCAVVQGGLQVTSTRKSIPQEVPYLRVANVYRGFLNLSEIKTIRATSAEISRTTLITDDLLVVEGHGNPNEIGRSALWTGEIKGCVHQNHIIRVRFDQEKIVPKYACEYLNSPGGRLHLLRAGKTTSGLNTISVSNVRETPIAVPPKNLQHIFAARIQALESLKATHRTALTELDALFASLQHRAFRGEL